MSRMRTKPVPPGSARTTMLPNCSTSASRPSVCTDNWNAPGDFAGGWLIAPAATWRLAACSDLARIEPDSHRVVARAEHVDVADPVDPRQCVLDVESRVVRDVLLIARAVRRDHVHDHHQVGRCLAHGDTEALHILR